MARKQILSTAALSACGVLATAMPAQAAPLTYETAVAANNPYVFYRQSETTGTTAADSSGNNRPGTYSGTPTLGVAGAGAGSDTAVAYDGTNNEYLSANLNSFGSMVGTSSYEFIFKVNPGAQTTQQSLFGVFTGAANLPDVEVTLNSNGNDSGAANNVPGNTRLFIRGNNADANGGASIAAHFTNAALYDGNFHHLVWTYDDAQTGVDAFKAYVDGVAQALTFTQVNGTVEPAGFGDFDVPAAFAARNVRSTGTDPFTREANVTLDEVALYGSILDAGDVGANFAATGIPEPGSLTLAGLGAVSLLSRRRRGRNA